jgi:hypothetical protein
VIFTTTVLEEAKPKSFRAVAVTSNDQNGIPYSVSMVSMLLVVWDQRPEPRLHEYVEREKLKNTKPMAVYRMSVISGASVEVATRVLLTLAAWERAFST